MPNQMSGLLPAGVDVVGMASRLADVPGVVGVTLGGSRARGSHRTDSDVDLGVYYRTTLDTDRIDALAREIGGPEASATPLGAWGPMVDGGSWLRVDGIAVDWIYRDLDRVDAAVADALVGQIDTVVQVGHPLGLPTVVHAGELALAVLLEDRDDALATARAPVEVYPSALRTAFVDALWSADFVLGGAAKAVPRSDSAYVAACLSVAVGVLTQAIHAAAGRWLINEKGAVAASALLSSAPTDFEQRVRQLMGSVGDHPRTLSRSLERARALVRDVRGAIDGDG